jgi:hypothetical protein
MLARLFRPSAELIVLTATLLSAVNALVVLDIVHLASAHLAIINIGLASVLGLVARGLVPTAPPAAAAPRKAVVDCRARRSEGGST